MTSFQAQHTDNQPLIDTLNELSKARLPTAETRPNSKPAGCGKLQAIAQALAQLDCKVTSGQELLKGPKKVEGVDKEMASCIDKFLKSGKAEVFDQIDLRDDAKNETGDRTVEEKGQKKEQDKKDLEYHGKKGTDPPCLKYMDDGYFPDDSEKEDDDMDLTKKNGSSGNNDEIYIDRVPVLTLWVTVVAERQGFSHEEALTFGRWISSMMIQSKGQARGIIEKKDKAEEPQETEEPNTKSQRTETGHVKVFQHIEIPVETVNSKQIAVESSKEPIKPEKVQDYLERAFGNHDLEKASDAMRKLADSVPQNELKDKAYEIYEMIRPEWHGWGKAGTLDLNKIHELKQLKTGTAA